MKTIKYFVVALAFVFAATGCTKEYFEADPGDRVTKEQLDKNLTDIDPFVQAAYAYMVNYNTLNLSGARHNDFGYMTIVLSSELWGQDMVQNSSAYGWFYDDYQYTSRSYEGSTCRIHWNFLYALIRRANDILMLPATDKPENIAIKGQALALRSFAYLNLAQLYQFTYVGNETKLSVPIVTEKTTAEQIANNPRVPLTELYALITKDLLEAVTLLEGYAPTTIVNINKNVAAGFLARAYLNMENWTEAAKYAAIAKEMGSIGGLGDGFVSIASNPTWMWGTDVNSETAIAQSGIVNYTSHISSIAYGYALAGKMYKNINKALFDLIPANDARKAWWAGAPLVVVTPLGNKTLPIYANVKFDKYNVQGDNFNDLCYMRLEEMYLIEAEAKGMGGDVPGAKLILEELVKTRQPDYVCTASTPAELQEAVWIQRRIELWGEGFAFNDLKRLKKGTDRTYTGSNHKVDAKYNLAPTSDFFNLRIPKTEIQNNKGIPEDANNPIPTL